MEIAISFSEDDLKVIRKLLKTKNDNRPLKEILEEKLHAYKIGLVFSAHSKLSEVCPKCGSIETMQDMDRNSIEDKNGRAIIFRKCTNCDNKFSCIWNPFERDDPSW
ncbi:MAG: hypothetical protein ACFE96_18630 [Candidatus Hermodarchaeota archaeon]